MRKKIMRPTLSAMLSVLGFLSAMLLALSVPAGAREGKKVYRIGYLAAGSAERDKSLVAAFRKGLEELGYSDGKNMVIEERYGGQGRYTVVLAELLDLKVDVIVTAGGGSTEAARKAAPPIPIVMAYVDDPVGRGLVASLARPGGNVTGLSDFHADIVTKRLELLKEAVPAASRVAVLLNPTQSSHLRQLEDLQAVAPALGVTLLRLEHNRRADDIGRAYDIVRKERPGGLLVFGGAGIGTRRSQVLDLAAKSRLPTIYTTDRWVTAGGLMSYGTSFPDLYRRAAIYVDKILKGANPGDLPVEQPMKFELVINLKTAKALGVKIPAHLLMEADKVIE